jgi:hypothetical protein
VGSVNLGWSLHICIYLVIATGSISFISYSP